MKPLQSVQSHFPSSNVERLPGTFNVVRVSDKHIIAKSIPYIEGDDDMTRERARQAYTQERTVLEQLPSWWGLRHAGSFETETDFVNMTNEIETCKWTSTRIPNPDTIAYQLTRQLRWLHSHNILHNDLELKNILLSCDGTRAVLIDFEKSRVGTNVTPEEAANEMEKLKEVLPPAIARLFPFEGRPRSMSAGRRKRTYRKRTTRKHK